MQKEVNQAAERLRIPVNVARVFDFESTCKPAKGWCMFKDGVNYGSPCETKKSLLIGYDLLSLAGLRKRERQLREKGITAHRCRIVTEKASKLFAVARNGAIQFSSVEWSTFCEHETDIDQIAQASFQSACGWIANQHAELERSVLHQYWFTLCGSPNRWLPCDKRRRRTHERLIEGCVHIMHSMGYSIVPVAVLKALGVPDAV